MKPVLLASLVVVAIVGITGSLRRTSWVTLTGLLLGLMVCADCSDAIGPDGMRLEVAPSDTTVVLGDAYPMRVRLFDRDGREVSRGTYEPTFTVSDTTVARVHRDSVITTFFGDADITVTVRSPVGSTVHAQARVSVGVIVH